MQRIVVLASHGMLAEGLLDTARMIMGELPYETMALSLRPGESPDELASSVGQLATDLPATEVVVLVDVYGASVFTAFCQLLCHPNVRLVTGMSLPMLLALLTEHDSPLGPAELDALCSQAREGVRALSADDLALDEEEDF